MTRQISLAGYSNSGKTTVACALIRAIVRRGESVTFVKQTHHPLTTENRGDTRRALEAGASEAILIRDGDAICWNGGEAHARHWTADDPCSTDWRLLEGFKQLELRPRILLIDAGGRAPEVAADLRLTLPSSDGELAFSDVEAAELLLFLDTIAAS